GRGGLQFDVAHGDDQRQMTPRRRTEVLEQRAGRARIDYIREQHDERATTQTASEVAERSRVVRLDAPCLHRREYIGDAGEPVTRGRQVRLHGVGKEQYADTVAVYCGGIGQYERRGKRVIEPLPTVEALAHEPARIDRQDDALTAFRLVLPH